jgi:hypothetical protein
MVAAEFIDVVLTPVAGGIGSGIGYGLYLRKNPEKALPNVPVWLIPVGVGVAVAAALFAIKMV